MTNMPTAKETPTPPLVLRPATDTPIAMSINVLKGLA